MCVTVLAAFWTVAAHAGDLADRTAAFRAALEDARIEIGFPGATAGFVARDGTAVSVAVGVADTATRRPMPTEARMMSGSTGKTYVAAVTLALARNGDLDLDAPITRYLGTPDWLAALPNIDRITLRQLLMHRSGLRDHVDAPEFGQTLIRLAMTDPEAALTPQQCIAFLAGQSALFEPGRGYAYSDTGYLLAGLAIEAATGRRFYDLADALFIDPLNLHSTTPAAARRQKDLVQAYPAWPEGAQLPQTILEAPGLLRWNPASEWTGGGFVTTARDAAVWAHALYGGSAMRGRYLPEPLRSEPIADGSETR
nr:serine hydrolase domain-containing protein [Sphingosinicella soli]